MTELETILKKRLLAVEGENRTLNEIITSTHKINKRNNSYLVWAIVLLLLALLITVEQLGSKLQESRDLLNRDCKELKYTEEM